MAWSSAQRQCTQYQIQLSCLHFVSWMPLLFCKQCLYLHPEMLWWTKITIGMSIKIGSFVQIIIKSEGYGYSPRGRTLILVSTDQASLWIYGLESGLAISLEIATQSGQELSPKNWQFQMTALYIVEDTWKARPETRKFNNVVTNTLARYWLIPSIMINP